MLIAAAKYLPEDGKAKTNEACGHEMLGDTKKAHDLVSLVRPLFPTLTVALACWIRTAPAEVTPEQCLEEVGELAESDPDIAAALAARFAFLRYAEHAEKAARDVVRLAPTFVEGRYLLGIALHQRGRMCFPSVATTQLLHESEECYTSVLQEPPARVRADLRVGCLHNRGILRHLSGRPELALADFEEALRLHPNQAAVHVSYCISFLDAERLDEAVAAARSASRLSAEVEHDFLLAVTLFSRNVGTDREEVTRLLPPIMTRGGPQWQDALELQVMALCALGRPSEARESLRAIEDAQLPVARRKALEARILLDEGDGEAARDAARQAVDGCPGLGQVFQRSLAQLLIRLELFDEAVRVLSGLAVPGVNDLVTRMLLTSASRANDHRVVIQVCRQLREAGTADDAILRHEFELLSQYAPRDAASLILEFLQTRAEDRHARLLLSLLGRRCEEPAWISTNPNDLPAPAACDPASVAWLATDLLAREGDPTDAIRFAYDVLRSHPEKADAHYLYITLFFRLDLPEDAFRSPATVASGTAVCYREEGTVSDHWVVIESAAPVAAFGECAPDLARIRPMLGAKVGDRFQLTTGIQERWARVIALRNSHLFRFERCRDDYETNFPDRHDFQGVRVIVRQPDGTDRVDLSAILSANASRREHVLQHFRLYRSADVPVHLLSELLGRDLYETLEALCYPGLGIRCWSGDAREWEDASEAAQALTVFVLDATALFTLRRLNLLDAISRWSGKTFVVSQAVFDHLRGMVSASEWLRQRAQPDRVGEEAIDWVQLMESQRRQEQAFRADIVSWVRRNAQIRGCVELAMLPPVVRAEWVALLGRGGAESICLSHAADTLLYTDDRTLVAAARTETPNIRRSWIQPLLQAAAHAGVIDERAYQEACARLIAWHYEPVRVDARVLLQAGRMTGWEADRAPFEQSLRVLGNQHGDIPTHLNIATELIIEMFGEVTSRLLREVVIRAILRNFARRSAASALAMRLEGAFGRGTSNALLVTRCIDDWLNNPRVWVPE